MYDGPVSAVRERDEVELVAEVTAKLCHKFADRSAILRNAGLDEAAWSRLETLCLERLAAEWRAGGSELAGRFSRAFMVARGALVQAFRGRGAIPADPPSLGSAVAQSVDSPLMDSSWHPPVTATQAGRAAPALDDDAWETLKRESAVPVQAAARPAGEASDETQTTLPSVIAVTPAAKPGASDAGKK